MTAIDQTTSLADLQRKLLAEAATIDGEQFRTQYHPLLSPIGWHLRHCVFVEALWIRERLRGDASMTAPLVEECLPERAPKSTRGRTLPDRAALLEWAETVMAENLDLLADAPARARTAWLRRDDYVSHFLIHHHAQHLETIRMARTARAITDAAPFVAVRPLVAGDPAWAWREISGSAHRIGAGEGFAFDNEAPAHTVALAAFAIAATPVDNAHFLAFIDDGGYRTPSLWSPSGWQWRHSEKIAHPYGWRRDAAGEWFGFGPSGPHDLDPAAAVFGLCHHEAAAFATWAGAVLPHENQWEVAARTGALSRIGEGWEWCANTFHPYPGFRFKPYREYSMPWFDDQHYVMRGASRHTEPMIARPSFRNYYLAEARHQFAGLRLVKSG